MKTSGARKIAERYVRAFFDVSRSAQAAVEKDLAVLQALLAGSAEFRSLLSNPLLTRAQAAQAAAVVLDATKASVITRQFIALLAKQKRLDILPEIITIYQDLAVAARGEMKAEVVSATPLAVTDLDAIASKLTKTYGKKIILEPRQDAEILGGMIINIGSQQLDSSLSGKLRRLANTLKAA